MYQTFFRKSGRKKIKILIADDHPLMRRSLRKILSEDDDLQVVAEAINGKEAVELTRSHSPHVVLMDVNMPEMNGIEASRHIISENASVLIIGISFHESDEVAQAMIKAGASSFLTKSKITQTLCAVVQGVVLASGTNR
ncbi:MAG: response regulator transcription factor [Balneolaceae bacterium]